MAAILDSLLVYVPDGMLAKWLLLVSTIAFGNSIQSYLTLSYTERVYNGPAGPTSTPGALASPATPLSSRTFGTWTMIQSIVRMYASYNLNHPSFYQLAFLTNVVAFAHFMGEWFIFKSTHWGKGLAGPLIISSFTMAWMLVQWDSYVQ